MYSREKDEKLMNEGLRVGDRFEHRYRVAPDKVVRHLFPEADEFATFPDVLATGFMVGLMEWACVRAMAPYLQPGEGSLGTAIAVTHTAPTPPGWTVTVTVELTAIAGRRLRWHVSAHDGLDHIGAGTHERAVIDLDGFHGKLEDKQRRGAAAVLNSADDQAAAGGCQGGRGLASWTTFGGPRPLRLLRSGSTGGRASREDRGTEPLDNAFSPDERG